MALTHSCDWDNIVGKGVDIHPAAYAKVTKVDIDRQTSRANITVEVYHDEAAKSSKTARPICTKYLLCVKKTSLEDGDVFETYFGYTVMDKAGMNSTKAAYLYIKTTDDFINWVNC